MYSSKLSIVSEIPSELCAIILSLLPDEDLITASHVSSFLRSQCLDDSLYVPLVKPRLEVLLQNNTSFPRDISSHTPAEIKELVCKLSCVSGTSYFSNIDSVRDFFLRQYSLKKSWDSGRPRKITKLRSPDGHRRSIDRIAIDPVFNQVISLDHEGLVCFWDVETGTLLKALRLELMETPDWETGRGFITLKEDVLLVATHASLSIHAFMRDLPSTPASARSFTLVASFSATDPVHSILLEGDVCVVSCWMGAVEFWDLKKEEQQTQRSGVRVSISPRKRLRIAQQRLDLGLDSTVYYRRPCLLLSCTTIVRISPRNRGRDGLLDLWDHPAEDIVWEIFSHVLIRDYSPHLVPLRDVVISQVGRDGSALIAFSNSGLSRIVNLWDVGLAVEGSLFANGPVGSRIRSFATMGGYFLATHTQVRTAWHKHPKAETLVYLYHENGDPIAEFVNYHPISETVMDPCFFVSAGLDRHSHLTISDFRPRCGPNKPSAVGASNPAKRRRAPEEKEGRKGISPAPSSTRQRGKKKNSMPSAKKTPKFSLAEAVSAPEDTVTPSAEAASAGMQITPNSADNETKLSQMVAISWGEAAIQVLTSHSGGRIGLSVLEILSLVLLGGLREIMVGEEEGALKEIGEALAGASQSSKVPIERIAASHVAEPRYRASRLRIGGRR
ncbi:hypothetical protein FGG08_002303 [Glutinoglossum americanum]|uniref:F-box domain-containing protein n=1 Tax=Glutinoglossum americanum TaxID=1670608 RepID=A0A9P8IFC8_9PEZI|nr:hypothetical protein FGG08_002303 [Glutinoglossum americanum]